jgi:GDP-mannose transporter
MSDEKKRDDDFTLQIDDSASRRSPNSFQAMGTSSRSSPSLPAPAVTNSPLAAILSYCVSSILMTCTNKYILGGIDYNLNFFLLAVQVRDNSSLGVWWAMMLGGL